MITTIHTDMDMDTDMMNRMMMMTMHYITMIGIMTTNRMMSMMMKIYSMDMVVMEPLVITGTIMTKRKMPFLLQIYKMNGWMNKMVPHGLYRKMQCRIMI